MNPDVLNAGWQCVSNTPVEWGSATQHRRYLKLAHERPTQLTGFDDRSGHPNRDNIDALYFSCTITHSCRSGYKEGVRATPLTHCVFLVRLPIIAEAAAERAPAFMTLAIPAT